MDSRPCKSCSQRSFVLEDESGVLVCSSCGLVQSFDNYDAQIGGISGTAGTYVPMGTGGYGSALAYKEKKIFEAHKIIYDIMYRLGFSESETKTVEVKDMINKITEGEFGQGDWFPVLVGACAYVVLRKDNRTYPIEEVAEVIGRDVYELGRMIRRVVDFLDLQLPEFDVVNSFERALKSCRSFSGVSKENVNTMLTQGVFIMQCAVKWFLTTGRRPLPMVAAVLFFVAELNQMKLKLEDVAKEVKAVVSTTKLRYKELLETLVEAAQVLPWGKDVTVKNIVSNAPYVIQYMERKSRSKPGEKNNGLQGSGVDMDDLVSMCLQKETVYEGDGNDTEENDANYFVVGDKSGFQEPRVDDLGNLNVLRESMSLAYSKFLTEVGRAESTGKSGEAPQRKRRRGCEAESSTKWWDGRSDMCKKLLLKQLLEKDIGLDAMPPSFVTSCLTYEKRRERINAAKLRIDRIMNPSNFASGDTGNSCQSECVDSGLSKCVGKRRSRRQIDDIDWEDFIIETLLLHRVEEKEIEKGYYNTLLDLHVFNSGNL